MLRYSGSHLQRCSQDILGVICGVKISLTFFRSTRQHLDQSRDSSSVHCNGLTEF
jgi:hypothetical protein